MKHGSLFSGIGGFDLAAQWAGWENVFHCELNTFGQKVLKHNFPKSISYEDITKTDFTTHRGEIDILTGGFPCQPFSVAGKRKGTDDPRHLWPDMLRAIREIRPRWVVGENVRGLVSWNDGLVFNQVCLDLEDEGFEVFPVLLPACGVNAPHRRDRVWFIAHASSYGHQLRGFDQGGPKEGERINEQEKRKRLWGDNRRIGESGFIANTESKRSAILRIGNGLAHSKHGSNGSNGIITDTNSERQPSEEHGQTKSRQLAKTSIPGDWKNFPTQSPLCSRNDGIPSELVGITFPKHRNESIKAYGNAIVPQVAYEIFKAIDLYEILY